jgi:hypothetical protein
LADQETNKIKTPTTEVSKEVPVKQSIEQSPEKPEKN